MGCSGKVLGYSVVLALVLFGFAGFTWFVMTKTQEKRVTGAYAVMLLVSLIFFAVIAYNGPHMRGKTEIIRT